MFADDFDFIDNDTIIFSDMNPKCGFEEFSLCFLELARDGRLIKLNLNTGAYEILADNLLSPNGIISHPDKQSIILSSTAASQLLRFYYAGPKKGNVEVFADGLPGLPDNLRATSSGKTFWIAFYLSSVGNRPLMQRFSEYPTIRKFISYYSDLLIPMNMYLASNHAVIIEMDFDGNVVSSVHELEGRLKALTNVIDDGKYLYFGSVHHNYIRRAKKPGA
uniref:Str_synth domain-containing protein n=2 Tax=Bursaphelenchus xylophilus TaxID=6326 RepID=A0A1I7RUB1_BURXY